MNVKKIKTKLEARDYFISPNYGLILKNENDESAIADIRLSEKKVVVPYSDEKTTIKEAKLMKILDEEDIPFRNKRFKS